MKKIQYFQLCFSIIPFFSGVFSIFVSYYYCYIRYKKNQFFFIATVFITFLLSAIFSNVINTPWIVFLIDFIICALHNLAQIIIQKKCMEVSK